MTEQVHADTAARSGPPRRLAALAVTATAAAGLLTPLADWRLHVLGYGLGALLSTVAVGLFRRRDAELRTSPTYLPSPALQHAVTGALLVGLGATFWHAFALATELAK